MVWEEGVWHTYRQIVRLGWVSEDRFSEAVITLQMTAAYRRTTQRGCNNTCSWAFVFKGEVLKSMPRLVCAGAWPFVSEMDMVGRRLLVPVHYQWGLPFRQEFCTWVGVQMQSTKVNTPGEQDKIGLYTFPVAGTDRVQRHPRFPNLFRRSKSQKVDTSRPQHRQGQHKKKT